MSVAPKKAKVKKDVKSKVDGYDGRLMAKNLITTIQVNLCITLAFWGATLFFLQLGCFGLDTLHRIDFEKSVNVLSQVF